MRIQHLNHSTYQHQYHIVWGTKGRRKFLKPYVKSELLESLYDTVKKYPTLSIVAVNTDADHVHLQIEIPPNIAVADAVQHLKANASGHLRRKFKFIREMYLDKDGIWGVGYFSSTVGLNEVNIRKYIEWQGKKEKPQTITLFNYKNKKA
ncbi:MAG: IS200/IS605 family transposase [Candidatus Magasanikbacteria bacterium]|nr:IS200/IS605 family transposase [Candidatus Magasanikbacteria bacterium]